MFFKKKISLKEYCLSKFNYILSEDFIALFDNTNNKINFTYTDKEDKENSLANFKAVYLQLIGITFSRHLTREQRYAARSLEDEYFEEKKIRNLKILRRIYNSAFGSSPVDGVEQMAIVFAENIQSNNIDKEIVRSTYYEVFYDILNEFFSELKKIKLI